MSKFLRQRELFSRFKKDTKGNFALVWAVGLTVTIGAVGAGIDLSTTSRVATTAQAAADQVALSSSVFYSINERLPENSDEGFIDGQIYRGDDAGFNFPNSVSGGSRRVKIRALYDEDVGEVTVKVWGHVETSFMGMFGRSFNRLPFSNEATAKFKETQIKNPASITLVLDNSGSMAWDDTPLTADDCEFNFVRNGNSNRGQWVLECDHPDGAERRIDGLIDSVETFMDIVDGYVGPQDVAGRRVLRTGMIPYDDMIINNREVDMDWGVISDSDIRAMSPSGATNSAPPIAQAWDWLQDENDIHAAESGEDNPLRYMIFMTDGQNSATPQWFPETGTGYWRGWDCTGRFSRFCIRAYETSPSRPVISNHFSWEEGELISASDKDSKNSCAAMKAQGVRVFTIGFALEPGTYLTNTNSNDPNDRRTIEPETTDAAYNLLADCASTPDDFVPAANVDTLDSAFAVIGESIVQDVIRLSQ